MALETDALRCGKTTGKTGFLCCRLVAASYAGESTVQSVVVLLITRSLTAAATAASRGRGARLARLPGRSQSLLLPHPDYVGTSN